MNTPARVLITAIAFTLMGSGVGHTIPLSGDDFTNCPTTTDICTKYFSRAASERMFADLRAGVDLKGIRDQSFGLDVPMRSLRFNPDLMTASIREAHNIGGCLQIAWVGITTRATNPTEIWGSNNQRAYCWDA